jgi:hypothetical protein
MAQHERPLTILLNHNPQWICCWYISMPTCMNYDNTGSSTCQLVLDLRLFSWTMLKYLGQQFFLLLCLLKEIHVTWQVNECFQVLKCLQYPRNNCLENKWQTNESLIQSIRWRSRRKRRELCKRNTWHQKTYYKISCKICSFSWYIKHVIKSRIT